MSKTRMIVLLGLFIALEIILTRFLSVQTPILRISFGFIPIAFSAMLFGPIVGGVTAAVSDILGMFIFPKAAFFPGFTLSAFANGCIYGLLLCNKPYSVKRTIFAVALIIILVDLGLNTLWLSLITGKGALALILPRLTKSLLMFPIQVFLIHTLWRWVAETLGVKSASSGLTK